ncbi:MAG: hypothetical protein LBC90_04765 [Candidatus Adiutrix sp.]|jgi:hypothetical protein|nr:hypothetical protein [Candidatus Adiutrix sp.]
MKRLALLLALILALAIFPATGRGADETAAPGGASEAAAADGAEKAADGKEDKVAEVPPAFSLSAQEGDKPGMLRLKAALRLLKYAQVTTRALQTCATAEAGKALKGFQDRNGKTIVLVLNVIKENGGVTPKIKAAMDAEVAADTEALLKTANCRALTDLVAKNARDLYKGPEVAEDYKLVKGK